MLLIKNGCDFIWIFVKNAKREKSLPCVLSQKEVFDILSCVTTYFIDLSFSKNKKGFQSKR